MHWASRSPVSQHKVSIAMIYTRGLGVLTPDPAQSLKVLHVDKLGFAKSKVVNSTLGFNSH